MTGSYELRDLDHASARETDTGTRGNDEKAAGHQKIPGLDYVIAAPCGEAGSESAVPGTDTGFAYYLAGRYDLALQAYQRVLAANSNFVPIHSQTATGRGQTAS